MRSASSVLFSAVVVLGCRSQGGEDATRSGEGFQTVDSAGVRISISEEPNAWGLLTWEVDSIPDLVIGAGDAPEDFLFRVQGMRGFSDGGLLIVNGGSQELRFYDTDGVLKQRIGGAGEGPGEFRNPALVPVVGSDTLLLFDKRLPRVQLFSMDGQYIRAIRHSEGWPYGRREPIGALPSHTMLFAASQTVGGEAAMSAEGVVKEFFVPFWYDPIGGSKTFLDSVSVSTSFNGRRGGGGDLIPFAARPVFAVAGDGAFIAFNRSPEIGKYDVTGRLFRIYRVEGPPRPVTREMIQDVIDQRELLYPGGTWDLLYARMPIPEFLPPFQALQVDELGWLWAKVYDADPGQQASRDARWMVFDTDGRARGIINLPAGLEVSWIGRDAILGVWTGEFDVEYVHRYRLRRK